MSINGQGTVEDADMTDDGEKVVTMMDVLQEQQEFEDDANAVLGASDDKNCTYSKGYIKRQAIYACLTCCSKAKADPLKRAGVCLACSLNCHENHDLVELYTKRNFRCDCGNPKFNSHPCQFTPNKTDLNEENNYDQNFSGLYCVCHRPYPDPEATEEDEMIQCIVCEDWLHAAHLEATVPPQDQYAEMVCKGCMEKNEFLHDYSMFAVLLETGDVDIVTVNGVDTDDRSKSSETEKDVSGKLKEAKPDTDIDKVEEKHMNIDGEEEKKETKADQDQEDKNIQTGKKLQAELTETKVPDSTDKVINKSESENEEQKRDNLTNVPMDDESVNTESASNKETKSCESITETDSEMKKPDTDAESEKTEIITKDCTESEKPKITTINDSDMSESIAEAVADPEKTENISKIEKISGTESDSAPASEEMSELERENALLEEPSTEKTQEQSIASENLIDTDDFDLKNNGTDDSAKEVVTNESNIKDNKGDEEQSESSMVVTECNNSVDTEKVSEQQVQEITKNTTENRDNKIEKADETENASEEPLRVSNIEKENNEISTSDTTIPPSEEQISNQKKDTSNVEKSVDSVVPNDIKSSKDIIDLPLTKDKANNEATSEDITKTGTGDTYTKSKETSDVPVTESNEVEMSDDSKVTNETVSNNMETNSSVKSQDDKMNDVSKIKDNKVCDDNESNLSESKSHDIGMNDDSKITNDTVSTDNVSNGEKSVKMEVSDETAKDIIDSEKQPENSDITTNSENKRKLSTDTALDDVSAKKAKLNECEEKKGLQIRNCTRPRGVKKVHKGATFWPLSFRQKLCTCNECLAMYKDLSVLFLTDPEDTVTAYETLGKERTDGGPTTQYEKGLQALSSLDRIQQINALTEYNKMRDKLLDFLKSFKDKKEIVKEEDIKAFFAGMKPKREPDGVYFCR